MATKAKFDRDLVVQKATDLYWQKGFNGTSMRNLQDVIDMRPGSIYAAFGSKEGLYKEALVHYAGLSATALNNSLKEAGSPLTGLALFTRKVVVDTQQGAPNGMCMLQKSVAELTDEQPELLAFAQQLLQQAEARFTELLKQSQLEGELSEDKDPKQLARYLQVQILGLRNYARVNRQTLSQQELTQLVDAIFTQPPFK
ncbi:TetR family transcriptional regulator [Photobacterium rosenbergii]|uniref:TetR family transcriptional regulator n=1 Tax=Photobacterium rosenbergii TaxID=294936 RepID=A0A2T3NJV2_9GAMM|nr:TetR/AcrR family transcriptional regulator [Photobacterium rosenbergii]PSW15796.1 TetR family transcriptional regulator [Photobacterium rosenbergii]